jgi:hypothetical protein
LKDLNLPIGETEEEKTIRLLTSGPHSLVKSWQAYDINGCIFYTKAKNSKSKCQNSGVRVDTEDSTGQKMLIMAALKKYENWIMECLYKYLYSNVNGWSTHKVLRSMIMCSQSLTWQMSIIKMNLGVSLQLLHKVFYILDPKDEKKYIIVPGKQWVVRVDDVEDEEEYNQHDEVPFFMDTRRINIIETKISYSNVIPYACTDGEGKLVNVE